MLTIYKYMFKHNHHNQKKKYTMIQAIKQRAKGVQQKKEKYHIIASTFTLLK